MKPEFYTDEELNDLPLEAHFLFGGLFVIADREGRLEDRPRTIKISVFPHREIAVDPLLENLAQKKPNGKSFIIRYEKNGTRLIQIVGFKRHQRITGKEAFTESRWEGPDGFDDGEASGNHQGNKGETLVKQPGSDGDTEEGKGKERKGTGGNRVQVFPGFDRFWTSYPRRTAKSNALKAWNKLKPDGPLVDLILASIEANKKTRQWQESGGQFIPHPATFLNQRRWEDEVSGAIARPATKVPAAKDALAGLEAAAQAAGK